MSSSGSHHDVDNEALGEYLRKSGTIPGLQLPITTTKIGYGQSNPTYFLDDAVGDRFILRKKPQGQTISPVAHQVDREFRVLQALGSVPNFPVPRVFILCTEESIIGTSFYVEIAITDAIGLEGYGKKIGFYARHCNTWSRIESQQAAVRDKKTGELLGRAHENYDDIMSYVRENLPGERFSIVHGDFKFDNLILHPSEPKVIAILDWELSTIGHPLMDLVYFLSPFFDDHITPGRSITGPPESLRPEHRRSRGIPEPTELLDRYAEIVGFDPRKDGGGKDWEIAAIFHYARSGTISHGIQARTMKGQASSEFSHIYFENTHKALSNAFKRVQRLKEGRGQGQKL
ncbi:putative acyl-CoA dehydrogenase IBR3 [Colletotrichum siamense]|uniref:putative acyl-CoA dehydrogenase IBR3 n=1 Tax=Colletotrichum siamense TaxID=690259 RepID=UPI001872A960|nr:putative acyl-CoA dehydrogenase IBR3 [Colletotrichum siamense]KAF5489010.1 putative acyl-CoA dehydrogenase IBR3 [Colletotrichum siamense]